MRCQTREAARASEPPALPGPTKINFTMHPPPTCGESTNGDDRSGALFHELIRRDHGPVGIELGFHGVVVAASLPKLRLPYPESTPLRVRRLDGRDLMSIPDSPHLGHHDLVGIVGHVQHLMGVVPDRPVLEFALSARGATLLVSGDFLAMLSRPLGHLDRSSCPGRADDLVLASGRAAAASHATKLARPPGFGVED